MMMTRTQCCFILPQVVLVELAREGDSDLRDTVTRTLTASTAMRSRRNALTEVVQGMNLCGADLSALAPAPGEKKTVYDDHNGGETDLPGVRKRGEGDPADSDEAVNEAYENADHTHDFYRDVLGRESLDGQGMELVSSVHFGTDFDNAFWNGLQMVYGDGSGTILKKGSLTKEISVAAHEITHGVVQFTAGLRYSKQSGALNESMADVFGSIVRQRVAGENAAQADWLIGKGVLGTALHGDALRSMKAPGTAFDRDRQPAHMRDYVDLPDDNDPRHDHGGVHINSGIPNKAFYLVATRIGGSSWEKAGPIWYDALCKHLRPTSDFKDAAQATIASAAALYGGGGDAEKIVRGAWEEVGVL
jgi:Zn-dependent metalloprotease